MMDSNKFDEILKEENETYKRRAAEVGEDAARKEKDALEILCQQFYAKHPTLRVSRENGFKLYTHLVSHGLTWCLDSLEQAYDQLEDQLDFMSDRETRLAGATAAARQEAATKKPAYPWPTPLTYAAIATMERKDFRRFSEHPEFKKQLSALGIRS